MSKDKLGQEPAFPLSKTELGGNLEARNLESSGMSKRYWTAVMIAQGFIASESKLTAKRLTEYSFNIADILLEQENK